MIRSEVVGFKPLDFIIIGAQKAGTTSLFKYLQYHPMLYMPPEKEALFLAATTDIPRMGRLCIGIFCSCRC